MVSTIFQEEFIDFIINKLRATIALKNLQFVIELRLNKHKEKF